MNIGKGIAVVFVLVMLGSIFAGAMPAVAQAAPETSSVHEDYETIMTAVNATRSGVTSLEVDSDGDGISDYDEINGFTWGTRRTSPTPISRVPIGTPMKITWRSPG